MASFRLDQEPWIPVVRTNGVAFDVSLVDVFIGAHRIAGLGGSPLEAAALTRFLLAIAHLTETPTRLDGWARLWQARADFMRRCAQYVASQAGAWDLFDAKRPFGQDPGLQKTNNPAHLLIYEAARKNNAVFLDHSIESLPRPIPAPALARGLITVNAYAGSSGGGYRSGPLAMRLVLTLAGRTLDETLLLNLITQSAAPAAYDWRLHGRQRPHDGLPDLARRYLWTSRRVRLVPAAGQVGADVMRLAPGDEMPETERSEDPMVVMRTDAKGESYVPLRLEAGRALWRWAHVLLNWHDQLRPLAVVSQLHKLVRRGLVPGTQPVSARVCGVAGGAKGPSTVLWRDEALPLGLSVVADERRFAQLARAVTDAEEGASSTRKRIYSFASRYLLNGAGSAPNKVETRRLADELSPDLNDYWAILAPAGERIACDGFDEVAWSRLIKSASAEAFRHAVNRLAPDARRHRAEYAQPAARKKKEAIV